jgi:hypothetical protein
MPRDGSGNYSKPDGTTAVSGTTVASAPYNTLADDMAAALTGSVPRNGSGAMTANLPMGGNKITGLAAATANGDAVRYEQYQTAAAEGSHPTNSGIAPLASQAEAEALTDQNNTKIMTSLRVKQAIFAWFATVANIFSGAASKIVTADKLVESGVYVPVAFNTTLTIDCDTGLRFSCEVTDDFTLNLTDGKPGHIYAVKIIQGTGAPHAAAYGANIVFTAAIPAPTLSTSQGDEDVLLFYCDTSSKFVFQGSLIGI